MIHGKAKEDKPSLFPWEVFLIGAVLLIAALAHGVNMFHFPYFEDDEGTYMSQAWAVVHLGKLSYYTYWYDHAPGGWLQIALWSSLTGGFHTFGSANYSGRILMLLFQVGSTYMVYTIARNLSGRSIIALIASLLFALSPWGTYYHRRILLDNIATFWMLLTILLLTTHRLSLNRIWLSALTLSISILSKEVTVFLVPAMAYLVFVRADKSHRWFVGIGWIVLVCLLLSLYPLMAILKNELFPTGTFLGGNTPHVSLLGTLQYQASRDKDGGLFSLDSAFWNALLHGWIQGDPILVIFGTSSSIISVLVIKKHRLIGIMGLLTLSLWVFLARGGMVTSFYLVPLLPLLSLNLALTLGLIARSLYAVLQSSLHRRKLPARFIEQGIIIGCLLGIILSIPALNMGYGYGSVNKENPFILWNGRQADAQIQATEWIKKYLPQSSRMIIDEYMWTDLYDSGYTSAHYYWKVFADPAIRDSLFHDNWRNFDYIVTTPQMMFDMQRLKMQLLMQVMDNSTPVATFDTGHWYIEIRQVHQ